MNWTKYIAIAGCLSLSILPSSTIWAQSQKQVTPTKNVALVEGIFWDADTKKPIPNVSITAKTQSGVVQVQQNANADGAYQIRLDPRQSYVMTAKATGYAPLDEQITFTSPAVDHLNKTRTPTLLYRVDRTKPASSSTVAAASLPAPAPVTSTASAARQTTAGNNHSPAADNQRVVPPKTLDAKVVYTPPLVVAAVGKTTQLRALQFVQSKTELLPDAQPALEQLLQFMQSQPTAEIELSGHTDNQGDFDQNLALSKQRVDVIKAYLVSNGIAANRITTRGYGPTRPIASNNSETTRQLNRRVEMIVLKQ